MQTSLVTFEDAYVTYFSRMKYFAMEYVLSEEDAENIVQDVFTELWERRDLLVFNINLVAFLFTSIKNNNELVDQDMALLITKIGVFSYLVAFQATASTYAPLFFLLLAVSYSVRKFTAQEMTGQLIKQYTVS